MFQYTYAGMTQQMVNNSNIPALSLTAPAKINLFFEVLGKRDDGFHEIVSVATPISLADTLHFTRRDDDVIRLAVSSPRGEPIDAIPTGDDNLVVKMLRHVRRTVSQAAECGADVALVKRIPSQAGLGGGSSDAATALLLANEAWKLNLTRDAMIEIGGAIGSDVPLFLVGGASVSRGRGEHVQRIASLPRLDGVVVKPREGLSTADVYRVTMLHHDGKRRDVTKFLDAVSHGDFRAMVSHLFNRLESPAFALLPSLAKIHAELTKCGGVAVQMSGSGTAFFTLAHHAKHAKQIAARIRAANFADVFLFTNGTR
ncbi:MAG: 4-(cytidine 5'-diphospho)-2-C-methyl-D-erythritol kinase [Thermoguttaceae bacterium]